MIPLSSVVDSSVVTSGKNISSFICISRVSCYIHLHVFLCVVLSTDESVVTYTYFFVLSTQESVVTYTYFFVLSTQESVVTYTYFFVLCTLGQALHCYVCNYAESNEDCSQPEHLQRCTDGDTCRTRISSRGGNFKVQVYWS